MIKLYDYETSSFKRTFDTYEHVDCFNYMDIHDQLKLIKGPENKTKNIGNKGKSKHTSFPMVIFCGQIRIQTCRMT